MSEYGEWLIYQVKWALDEETKSLYLPTISGHSNLPEKVRYVQKGRSYQTCSIGEPSPCHPSRFLLVQSTP